MKFKVIFLVLIGGSLIASELPTVAPKSPSSVIYRMPKYDVVFGVLNSGNDVPNSTFYYERTNADIAYQLAEKKFTRKDLVTTLHTLTQPGVANLRVNPLCSHKASLLVVAAQEL